MALTFAELADKVATQLEGALAFGQTAYEDLSELSTPSLGEVDDSLNSTLFLGGTVPTRTRNSRLELGEIPPPISINPSDLLVSYDLPSITSDVFTADDPFFDDIESRILAAASSADGLGNIQAPQLNAGPGLPDVPEIEIPPLDLLEIGLESKPDISFPVIEEKDVPQFTAQALEYDFAYVDEGYVSDLLSALKDKMLALMDGSTGLDPAFEAAIWQRRLERNQLDMNRKISMAKAAIAGKGFSLPPGRVNEAVREIAVANMIENQDVSREASMKQYEAALQVMRDVLSQGTQLESILTQYYGQWMSRVLDAKRAEYDIKKGLFAAAVDLYNTRVTEYKLAYEATDIKLKLLQSRMDVYKTGLESEKLKVDVNSQLIEQYKSRIASNQFLVDIYKARLEACRVFIEINRGELDLYKSQLEADNIKGTILSRKLEAYQSATKNEQARAEAHKISMESDELQLRAAMARNDALLKQVESHKQYYLTQFEALRLAIEQGRFDVGAQQAMHEIISKYEALDDDYKYRGHASLLAEQDLWVRKWNAEQELKLRRDTQAAEVDLKAKQVAVQSAQGIMNSTSDLAKALVSYDSNITIGTM